MTDPHKPGEVPDTQAELAKIHERQKARGKDEPVELPAMKFETAVSGKVVDSWHSRIITKNVE